MRPLPAHAHGVGYLLPRGWLLGGQAEAELEQGPVAGVELAPGLLPQLVQVGRAPVQPQRGLRVPGEPGGQVGQLGRTDAVQVEDLRAGQPGRIADGRVARPGERLHGPLGQPQACQLALVTDEVRPQRGLGLGRRPGSGILGDLGERGRQQVPHLEDVPGRLAPDRVQRTDPLRRQADQLGGRLDPGPGQRPDRSPGQAPQGAHGRVPSHARQGRESPQLPGGRRAVAQRLEQRGP